MEPIGTAIAVHLLSAFIHDSIKLAEGEEASPRFGASEQSARHGNLSHGVRALGCKSGGIPAAKTLRRGDRACTRHHSGGKRRPALRTSRSRISRIWPPG